MWSAIFHILHLNSKNGGVVFVLDVTQKGWWEGSVERVGQKRELELHLQMWKTENIRSVVVF